MAFCCSSARDSGSKDLRALGLGAGRVGPEERWRHRAAATAAVDITNLVVNPGKGLQTKSLLSHDKKPNTRDLAGNSTRGPHRDEGYYGELQSMSPAAPLPPIQARSVYSTASSLRSTVSTRAVTPAYGNSGQQSEVSYEDQVDAWKRDVAQWKMQLETCLHELADAIRKEDFDSATSLKRKRDELQSRPMPPKPIPPPALSDSKLYGSSAANSVKSYQTVESGSRGDSARTASEGGGLGFLFTVWQHNPVHTAAPDNVHR
jgi:hypothetical protein